jgi:hypothetical protein
VATDRKGTDSDEVSLPRGVTLPVIGLEVHLPGPDRIAWYLGLGVMAALEVIDWELALLIGIGHLIADNVHNRAIAGLAKGVESGA